MPHTTFRGLATAALLAATLAAAGAPAALAADPKVIGSFKDWNAFTFDESGKTVCYISSQPKKKEPASARRGDIYVLVTHRPSEKTFDVVSFILGYPLRKGSEATVEIDGKSFSLFTDGETAWARDADTDKAIVAAMRTGSRMVMKGTSQRNTKTTDSYSLAGISEAHEAIGTACKAPR